MAFARILLALFFVQLASSASINTNPNTGFAPNFFYQVANEKYNENVVVSPVSVHTCMAMTFFGAKGQTADEMVKGLYFTTSDKDTLATKAQKFFDSPSSLVKFANAIYLDKSYQIKADFNDIARKSFKAEAKTLDFGKAEESANKINQWVESKTNNKIKNLVSPETMEGAGMILVNAIHFKGKWQNVFAGTQEEDFWSNGKTPTKVDMMNQGDSFKYAKFDNLEASAIEMPYEDSDLSMVVILPNERTGLQKLVTKLKDTNLSEESKKMQMQYVEVKMPKFEIEFDLDVNDILKEMGMSTMFTDAADFSDLVNERVKVSKVAHKAFINCDEVGTEAAAATYGKMVPMSLHYNAPEFTADHPFVFVIKDNAGVIYFMGHVAKF